MLIRKMLRDVWKNKVPFIAIFIMMFAGNFIFSGITSEYNGISSNFEAYIEETNLADAWVFGNSFTDEDINKLCESENIYNIEKRMFLSASLDSEQEQALDLYILDNKNDISSIKVIEGEQYSPKSDRVWLDYLFAQENGLKPGDEIKIQSNGLTMKIKIAGLCYHPEYVYSVADGGMIPNHQKYGFVFLNKNAFPYPDLIQWNQLAISGQGDLSNTVQDQLQNHKNEVLLQKNHPSFSMIQDEMKQHREIGLIFVFIFLFIAVLVTVTTVHRLLGSQRLQIGILKTMGFKKRRLYVHYISHSTLVCLAGSFVGWCAGYLALPPLILTFMREMYAMPEFSAKLLSFGWGLPLMCAAICLILSFCICKKYLTGNAAAILYSNSVQREYRELPLAVLWKHLSFYSQWNARDIFRNKLRSIMTVLGVVGCVSLLFASFGLYTSMMHMSKWTFETIQTYDAKVLGSFTDTDYKNKLLEAMSGEELMESSIEITLNGNTETASFTALETNQYLHLMKDENTEITLNEGIALSKNTAEDFGIKSGDIIHWRFTNSEEWYSSKVSEIIRTPTSQGITITKKEMARNNIPFAATSIIGNIPDKTDLRSDYVSSVQYREDLKIGLDTMMNASVMMCGIFLTAAVLLGSVILYNLGTLSYMERYRDMATLKVLGFPNNRIRKLMIQQNVWLTILGILIGLPVGYGFLLIMMGTVQSSIGVNIYIPAYIYIISILSTFLLSFIINMILSGKVKFINMVAALKSNE